MASDSIPTVSFWLMNIDPALNPAECPPFLEDLSAKDISIIGSPEGSFHPMSWSEVQQLIKTNRIDLFQRSPLALRKYREYTYKLNQRYGSVMAFIVDERLRWTHSIKPKSEELFDLPDDYKILRNDWPYGIDPSIIHIVVWMKHELCDDPATGDLTTQCRAQIDAFVAKTFCERVPSKHVIWFWNWKSLKSIHAVEHFHVMLYTPAKDFVDEVTNGDIPLSERV